MSDVASGLDDNPTRSPTPQVVGGNRRRWHEALTAALLALVNFAGLTLMLLHLVSRYQHEHNDVGSNVNFFLGSDLVMPLIGWTWFLILLNGTGLCCRQRTRACGLGLLGGAAAIALPVVVWAFFALVTY